MPIKVSALSQAHKDFYEEQKKDYQIIANVYTDWYTFQQTVSQTSNRTKFYFDP